MAQRTVKRQKAACGGNYPTAEKQNKGVAYPQGFPHLIDSKLKNLGIFIDMYKNKAKNLSDRTDTGVSYPRGTGLKLSLLSQLEASHYWMGIAPTSDSWDPWVRSGDHS